MTAEQATIVRTAIRAQVTVGVLYNKPDGGPVWRYVRPYELSVNSAGRPVVWGTDSVHGPSQIHCFRTDRILQVRLADNPVAFTPRRVVSQHLRSFDDV